MTDTVSRGLVTELTRCLPVDGATELGEGVRVFRASRTNEPLQSVSSPAFCVIAQGRKDVSLGDHRYTYDPDHYLITSVNLPVTSQIVEASSDHPYLSLRMELDATMVGAALLEVGNSVARVSASVQGMDVCSLDEGLRSSVLRLVKVAREPQVTRYVVPLIKREIVYRLLLGDQGARLRHLATDHVSNRGISRAIERLRSQFDQPLSIEGLARDMGMSVSGFHHHFKEVTAMSPLQFQKHLRLQEARRLMVGEGLDATSAGYRVGYGSPSHFSREYKRLFGSPPIRDSVQMRYSVLDTHEA